MKTFHFTLGPVQGFVAQARRSRDLWAGSFLLSWLSGHAMKAVPNQGGNIVFPAVTDENGKPVDPVLRAICGDYSDGNKPQIGSIPNRFKASVPNDFDPLEVAKAVQGKWRALADAVYTQFVQPVETQGRQTKEIWDRQIANFWEINWVLSDPPEKKGEDDRWLDIRKNWRSHWPQPEGGDHCTVMGDYQELSGYVRAKEREKQDGFWQAIRDKAPDDYLDIRENERLCAMALVKRLFPRLHQEKLRETIGWIPGGRPQAVGNWPSTTYMGLSTWLARINGDDKKIKLLDEYICKVHNEVGAAYFKKLASERATRLPCLDKLNETPISRGGTRWKISDIDGDLLHIHALKNHRTTYLSDSSLTSTGKDANKPVRDTLVKALEKLYQGVESRPRSYYALLLMDGDKLGMLLREQDQGKVSTALLDFTRKVKPCVDDDPAHSGITIYAGGDDVFAMLPLDTAIACARALRSIYNGSFANVGISATASCAIVYAHHQVPLRQVIHEAHHQLDNVAKDKNGRNSLALAVYKPGGVTAQWVSAWEHEPSPVDRLMELIEAVDQGDYPRGFFHKLRDRYGFYEDEKLAAAPDAIDMEKLLIAEYMQTRDPMPTRAQAEQAAERLKSACQPLSRDAAENIEVSRSLKLDGGFIARFLTQKED